MDGATFETNDINAELPQSFSEETVTLPNKRKWIPYLVLVFLFVAGLVAYLCIPLKPQVLTDPDMPWFSICDGVLSYDSTLYTGEEELTVPESIAGQTVTSIGGGCFAGDDFITTVDLPKTIQVIGESAFADCTALRGVFLPDGIGIIADKAFRGCTSLESVCIPSSVQRIGNEAFANCPKLLHIFYNGTNAAWASLYTEQLNPQAKIYTSEGVLNQKDIAKNSAG